MLRASRLRRKASRTGVWKGYQRAPPHSLDTPLSWSCAAETRTCCTGPAFGGAAARSRADHSATCRVCRRGSRSISGHRGRGEGGGGAPSSAPPRGATLERYQHRHGKRRAECWAGGDGAAAATAPTAAAAATAAAASAAATSAAAAAAASVAIPGAAAVAALARRGLTSGVPGFATLLAAASETPHRLGFLTQVF